ncbi:hypothetical protein [Burkholderia contaminans]|uniref:hypothetical protein n=1 Tax=Burkholderia contaminans TaxID=488447 RepID=UPI0015882C3B|nr:hypothetical protein [Burkholderia contaminans]
MSYETEARLTALETIFIELAKRNSTVRDDLEAVIGDQYRSAVQRSQRPVSSGFQTGVLCDPKPVVDREAASALAAAYRSLAEKLGWSI